MAKDKKKHKPKEIPATENALVLRTDFSDERAWKSICSEIEKPQTADNFQVHVEYVSDAAFEGATLEQLLALDPKESGHFFMFVVDHTALSHAEHPILVIDLNDEVGRAFRVIPSEMWGVENNLSISNMDFYEFADNADADGIFRGFD